AAAGQPGTAGELAPVAGARRAAVTAGTTESFSSLAHAARRGSGMFVSGPPGRQRSMLRSLFDWYADLSPWLRFGAALFFIAISTALFFAGRFWPWGWAVGGVLLIFAFPNDAQKKGYHDF